MFDFIAGVRPSSQARSSWHLAITSQHLLHQARAHKAVGNLDAAKKSYREAIEKAKIEYEINPGNPQAKSTFDAISKEFLAFLKELPSNGHQEQAAVANLGEQSHIFPSQNPSLPTNSNDEATPRLRLVQRACDTVLSNSVNPASMSLEGLPVVSAQAKSAQADFLFEQPVSGAI